MSTTRPDVRRLRWLALSAAAALAVVLGAIVATVPLGEGRPSITIRGSRLLDQPAPPIELADIDGRTVRLADYRGRPVIVNFWASWCEPCKEEFPLFRAARERHAGDGLEILGVIHDDGPQAASEFAASQGADWPLLQDPEDAVADAYGVQALPLTFYVDGEGVVRAVSFGPPPSGVLDEQLAKIIPGLSGSAGP